MTKTNETYRSKAMGVAPPTLEGVARRQRQAIEMMERHRTGRPVTAASEPPPTPPRPGFLSRLFRRRSGRQA